MTAVTGSRGLTTGRCGRSEITYTQILTISLGQPVVATTKSGQKLRCAPPLAGVEAAATAHPNQEEKEVLSGALNMALRG